MDRRDCRGAVRCLLLAALVAGVMTACSGGGSDDGEGDAAATSDGAGATGGEAEPAQPDEGAGDGGGDPGEGETAGDGGATGLAWNECPIVGHKVDELLVIIEDHAGFAVDDDGNCRFSDGVRVMTLRVHGNNDGGYEREPWEDRNYQITDLDRGENAFVASSEIEAHARAAFDDLVLTMDTSSLELDHGGLEALARDVFDVAVRP